MFRRLALATAAILLTMAAQAQLIGSVQDETGKPVEGVNVVINRLQMGTVTNAVGEFRFEKLNSGNYALWISHIGYSPQEVEVNIPRPSTLLIVLRASTYLAEEVVVNATRANEKDPIAFTTLSKEAINRFNQVQDIPYLLAMVPSLVATSDAGTGVGYSGLRIRGTDPSRINVTINGIPYNDSESHDVYWVDIPDFAGSTENIQIQRGVGTSTHGAAAFGANINIKTSALQPEPFATVQTAGGSFNTWKGRITAGTGMIDKRFNVSIRLSQLHTDGFIDRAFSDLSSWYITGGYFTGRSVLKLTAFSGKERTYQAWGGVPSDLLTTQRTYNPYTYDNEVDDYKQDHYQVHWAYQVNSGLDINTALHLSKGRGFYEQFREEDNLADYRLRPFELGGIQIETSDLVRQKWLDNYFYGTLVNVNYEVGPILASFGGGLNQYDGDHYGEVTWATFFSDGKLPHRYYESNGLKTDLNLFGKLNWQLVSFLNLFADLQYRYIHYAIVGYDDDQRDITQMHRYPFWNPKAGITVRLSEKQQLFTSVGVAQREPKRSNFTDAPAGQEVLPERLLDIETGYTFNGDGWKGSVNLYHMSYKNQLILTGQINDVGAPIMINTPKSFRRGIELVSTWDPFPFLKWEITATFSRNKVLDFSEYVDDWDTWGQRVFALGTTDLAFAPSLMGASRLQWNPWSFFLLTWDSKFVGAQFIDNTSDPERMLDPYWVNDLTFSFTLSPTFLKEIHLFVQVINLLDHQYETSAWVYSYFYEGVRQKMDGYFPQAGRHFLAGLKATF